MNPLSEIIRDEIAQRGPMPFARFMELALYHPGHGYYERAPRPIGRRGDFYTSVSVGPLFGELLAFQFAEWLSECGMRNAECGVAESHTPLQLIEAGAHDGQLAADILGWLQRHRPELFAHLEYVIIEPSALRRTWQQEKLAPFSPRVWWLNELPTCSPDRQSKIENRKFQGVFFSNELLDAFPVHRLGWDAQKMEWFEWAVTFGRDRFDWTRLPLAADSPLLTPHSSLLTPALQRVLPDAFTIELCPAAESWWRSAAQSLARGRLLTFDYGFTDQEWLRPERPHGTLRAYQQHHASDDALANPGGQDLTAHVNFSALQRAGEAAGLQTSTLTTQASFLTSVLDRARQPSARFGEWTGTHTRQFQTLTHPDHLGERFFCLVNSREERR